MFVLTQFDTIVNLADFQKIKVEWHEKQSSGTVFHVISTESMEYTYKPEVGGPLDLASEIPVLTRKTETLANFPENMQGKAQEAYDDLFAALLQGKTAFDLKDYTDPK